mmetsp:Transcript_110620/g.319596  ORF Transcript_110620/g.319596 Transcript_110620/m.319596 type:complete len:183 (+) Transcript_110620:47-595(+)
MPFAASVPTRKQVASPRGPPTTVLRELTMPAMQQTGFTLIRPMQCVVQQPVVVMQPSVQYFQPAAQDIEYVNEFGQRVELFTPGGQPIPYVDAHGQPLVFIDESGHLVQGHGYTCPSAAPVLGVTPNTAVQRPGAETREGSGAAPALEGGKAAQPAPGAAVWTATDSGTALAPKKKTQKGCC